MRWFVFMVAAVSLASMANAQGEDTSDAQPLSPPVPHYPAMAAALGIEGYCVVRFSVDEDGFPYGLTTSCTEPVFCFASKDAVSHVRFRPKMIDGVPQSRLNIVYPLEFRLGEDQQDLKRDTARPCQKNAVS